VAEGVGQILDRRRRLEGRRAEIIKRLDATRPVLERERQHVAEEKATGLIRAATRDLDAARAELDARWEALLDCWENEYLDAVELFDRLPVGVPARPEYASLKAYPDQRVQVSHRPTIKRLVQADIKANNKAGACSALTDFIGLVKAQSGKELTSQQVASFTAQAKNIQATLGC
jgi:hypothetical protein